jgi:hypothetical protein
MLLAEKIIPLNGDTGQFFRFSGPDSPKKSNFPEKELVNPLR